MTSAAQAKSPEGRAKPSPSKPANGIDAYLTIAEAAARAGCAVTTIYRRVKAGELTLHRVLGRSVVEVAELDRVAIPGGRWKSPKSGRQRKR
jgi:excisionase family DNA binding protein